MEPMKNIPVYRHSAAYAVEHGELEAYKTSRVAGVACRDAIEKAVAKHYRDNCLNKAGAREVIDEFGKERVMTVLAITIRDKLYDGRFSSANKAWAQAFPIEPDIDSWGGNRNLTLVVRQTHPGLLNLFCDQAKAYESEKVSVREKLKAAAKNAPVPSTKKEMERRSIERQKRDIQIKFRVTADERALLERKMREAGTTNMGAYLRKMALDGYILRLDLPELKEMLSQLRYMGNNVNQIAKRANEVGVIDEMDIRGVSKRQERMLEQMARLLEKLSGLN